MTIHYQFRFALTLAVLSGVIALTPTSVFAQADDDAMSEIIVTTRKIEENLKEIPLDITAFTSKQIESAGINNLNDIANLTPGLQFFNPIGEFLPVPIIRGVAPTDIRGENNTGIFVDGVFVSGREGLNFSQLDVERIEVVKGPQSALYGRSAFSGAINYVTKRPSDVFEMKSEATGGNDGIVIGSTSVSGPIFGDTFRGRAAFLYDDWDGSYDNPVAGGDPNVGGHRYRTYQGSLLYEPDDKLEALLNVYHSNDEIDDAALTSLQANCEDDALYNPVYQDNGVPVGVHYGNYCGKLPKLSGEDIPKTQRALGEDRYVTRGSLTVNWDIDVGTVDFLTGYTYTEQHSLTDFNRDFGNSMPFTYCTDAFSTINDNDTLDPSDDVTSTVFCSGPTLERFNAGVLDVENGSETKEFSQEIRFTGPLEEPFRYSAGAYYYDNKLDVHNGDNLIQGTIPAGLVTIDPPQAGNNLWCPCQKIGAWLAPFGSFIFGPSTVEQPDRVERTDKTEAWAVFSWLEQDFLEKFTGRLELRYTDEKRTLEPLNSPDESKSWDAVTGRVSLKYQVNDRWMTYGYVANAEKSGGFDADIVDLVDPDDPTITRDDVPVTVTFDPEKNITYEVGLKGKTSDGRVGIDLAFFYIDWTDIVLPQVFTSVDGQLISGGAISLNDNGGDATVTGFELGTQMEFTDDLTGSLGLSYQDATWDKGNISSFQYFPSFQPDGDISGNQLLRQAPWTASGSLSYSHQLSGDWKFYSRGDVSWRDEWYVGNDNQSTVPASTNVNLRVGVESGRYSVELWGDNIFDNSQPAGAFRDIYWTDTSGANAAGEGDLRNPSNPPYGTLADFPVLRLSVNQPNLATYGITARARFGGAER